MKRFLIGLIVSALFFGAPLANAGSYTANNYFWKPAYRESGPAAYNSYNAALDATDLFLASLEPLPALIANWAITDQIVTMIPVAPTYIDVNTFQLLGDYTSRFPAGAVVHVQFVTGTMGYSTVSSSTFVGAVTSVDLTDNICSASMNRIYVVATRDGLWPNGPGYVVARDYGTTRAALEAADAVATAAGKELRITYAYTIDADVTLASPKVTVQPGVPFAISTGNTLTISGSLNAGSYQIFSCTGTGAVSITNKTVPIHSVWFGTLPQAVAAVPAGGRLIIDAATYNLTAALAISQNDVTVEGQGDTTILVSPSSGSVDSVYITGDRVTFKNLKITPTGTYSGSLVHVYQAPNAQVTGLFLDGSAATANYGYGIWVQESDKSIVQGNRFTAINGATNRGWNNIQIEDSADVVAEHNYINGGRQWGINVISGTGVSTGAKIAFNTVQNTVGVGVLAWNGYASIIGNRIKDCGVGAIYVTGDTTTPLGATNNGTVVIGNMISGITGTAAAIGLEWDVHFFSVIGNTIIGCYNGIGMIRDVTDGVVSGNTISGATRDGIQSTLYAGSPNARINIQGNVITSATRYGIYVDEAASNGIQSVDNIVTSSGTANFSYAVGVLANLTGSATWDPASIADGAMTSTTVTVSGARTGSPVYVAFSNAVPAGALLAGNVTANGEVTVTLFNKTGGALDLASGTLSVDVWKH